MLEVVAKLHFENIEKFLSFGRADIPCPWPVFSILRRSF
jgi:hypothetical protein